MSRSALWRQETNVKEREMAAEEAWKTALEEGKDKSTKNLVPIQCRDESFNLNRILLQNIKKSSYFLKLCSQVTNWSQAVDEIYYKVDHLEPWSVGGKIPSSAYCILVRLFLLRVSKKEMNEMLIHPDSPYIIGVGLLYLRYTCDPELLWDYFKVVMNNETEIKCEQRNKKYQTISEYAISLLRSSQSQFPRIPARIEDIIYSKLEIETEKRDRKRRHLAKGNDRHFIRGTEIIGMYEDEENPMAWYDAVIMEVHSDYRYTVKYTSYGNVEEVGIGEIDFPDSREAKDYSDKRRYPYDNQAQDKRYDYDARGYNPDSRGRKDDDRSRYHNDDFDHNSKRQKYSRDRF